MDLYYNKNGMICETGTQNQKLTALPVGRTFLWEEQELFIPTLYVSKEGVVLHVCAKIPSEDMIRFLKKWNKRRRLSLETAEEFEQMDADNPGSREFLADMSLDGRPLKCRSGSSCRWYPPEVFAASETDDKEWRNDRHAEALMAAYKCDKTCCWHFGRLLYDWDGIPVLSPNKVSLRFQAHPISVTAGHFTTDPSCCGQTVRTVHPGTGQEYVLTLHGCEQVRHDFSKIGAKGIQYPEYGQLLTYSVSPDIERSLLDIRDCAAGDRPREEDASCSTNADGPTAYFVAMKRPTPGRRMAASSQHFEPVDETHWRVVFQVKDRDDLEVEFELGEK